jgi:hypothetical protein
MNDGIGSPLYRLRREAAATSGDTVNVLAGDFTDCGGVLADGVPHGKTVAVSTADLNAVIDPPPAPTPEVEPVAPAAVPEPKPAAKSRRKRSTR